MVRTGRAAKKFRGFTMPQWLTFILSVRELFTYYAQINQRKVANI